MNLNDVLKDESKRTQIIDEVVKLIEGEVGKQRGLGGVAVKAGYKLVQGVKPGFVRNVVVRLLPEFAEALGPFQERAAQSGQSASAFFGAHAGEVAEALLAVTDGRAASSGAGSVKGAYTKLRGSARKNVEAAVPGLGAIVDKYA